MSVLSLSLSRVCVCWIGVKMSQNVGICRYRRFVSARDYVTRVFSVVANVWSMFEVFTAWCRQMSHR